VEAIDDEVTAYSRCYLLFGNLTCH
jgi:hypothetical protein